MAVLRRSLRADATDQPRTWMRRHWRLTTVITSALLFMVLFDAWLLTCGFDGCPSNTEVRAYQPPEGGRLLDRFGKPMGRMYTVRRVNVPLASVPLHVRRAFIATEDRRFFEHRGIDWRGVVRAIVRNTASLRFREAITAAPSANCRCMPPSMLQEQRLLCESCM